MMFSLARSGYAPLAWGKLSKQGTPVRALWVSGAGLGLALVLSFLAPGSAFVYLFGISLFGGLYAWLIIFVTHIFFRRRREAGWTPMMGAGSLIGALAIAAILATTWRVEGMRITLIAGASWLAVLTGAFLIAQRRPATLIG